MSDVTAAAGLAGFLLDRYREDEAAFRHDGSGGDPSPNWSEISGHMLPGFTFERALADLDAKRRIVELHADDGHPHRVPMPWPYAEVIGWKCAACGAWCSDGPSDGACPVDWRPPAMTLRLLALPYVSHPSWRAEWRA